MNKTANKNPPSLFWHFWHFGLIRGTKNEIFWQIQYHIYGTVPKELAIKNYKHFSPLKPLKDKQKCNGTSDQLYSFETLCVAGQRQVHALKGVLPVIVSPGIWTHF